MRCGRLKHSISIEQTAEAADAYGAVVNTWTEYKAVRAAIEPINGREYFAQDSRHAEVTARIRIRYLAGLTHKMRVKFGTRYFNIVSIINDKELNKEHILMVTEDAE